MNNPTHCPWSVRLWHWISALVTTGLLLTVILTATVSKVVVNARLVRTMLVENHVAISYQQSLAIGRAINAPYWELHCWLGYGLAVLLAFRLLTELFLPAEHRLLRKIIAAYRARLRHGFWVKIIYLLFYAVLFISVITGLLLTLQDRYPVLQQYALIHDLHELNTWFFLLFIAAHVAGVCWAERRSSKGVVLNTIGEARL
jgi:Ni/Fe-hydrogenase 1 B-type cytochrome subunit